MLIEVKDVKVLRLKFSAISLSGAEMSNLKRIKGCSGITINPQEISFLLPCGYIKPAKKLQPSESKSDFADQSCKQSSESLGYNSEGFAQLQRLHRNSHGSSHNFDGSGQQLAACMVSRFTSSYQRCRISHMFGNRHVVHIPHHTVK